MADAIAKRQEELAELITEELGCTLFLSQVYQVVSPVMSLNYNAEIGRSLDTSEVRLSDLGPLAASSEGGSIIPMAGASLVVQEPVGVVAAFPAYNFAFPAVPQKVAPALIAGCTAVVKVTEPNPLATFIYGDICEEVGLPPGVINIVAARAPEAEYLVRHPGVDMVSFTGSVETGARIAAACGELIKPCVLELGGKSAAIVLDDAKLEDALPVLIGASVGTNAGQSCVALTRLVVPAARYDEYAEALVEGFRSLKIGDPMEADTVISPLVTERQRDRVEEYVELARKEGATIATGGRRPAGLDRGWYFEPTLVTDADNDMRVSREEIFGPVASLIPHHGEDDAVRIANDSELGLSGAVFTADDAHGFEIARTGAHRDVLGQHLRRGPRLAVRWLQEVRHRSRARADGLPGVPALQDHLGRPEPSAPRVRDRGRTARDRTGHAAERVSAPAGPPVRPRPGAAPARTRADAQERRMDDQFPHVFSPFRLGGFDLRNRLVALPAGTSLVERGIPTHGDVEHFERLAAGGVGLIIGGATVVHPTSALRSGKLVEGYLDEVVPAMTEKADVVHRHGARLVGQLCHLGREFIGGESDQPPMAPSPIKTVRDAYPPHELTVEEIDDDHRGLAGLHGEPRQGRARRRRDPRGARLPARAVPVAADQPAVRRLRRLVREPDALPAPGDRGDALGHPGRIRARRPAQRRGGDPRRHGHRRLRADRRGPRRRWAASTTSASPTAPGASTSRTPPVRTPWRSRPRPGSAPPPGCRPWSASGSATSARPSTPSRPATPTWSAWRAP